MAVQIQVSDEVWDMLKDRKKRPSHTWSEIIKEALLEIPEVEDDN